MKDHDQCRHAVFCDLIDRIYEAHDLKHVAACLLRGLSHWVPSADAVFWPIDHATLEIQPGYRLDVTGAGIEHAAADPYAPELTAVHLSHLLQANGAIPLPDPPSPAKSKSRPCRDDEGFTQVSLLGGWYGQPLAVIRLQRRWPAAEFSAHEISMVNRLASHAARAMYLLTLATNPPADWNVGLLLFGGDKRLIVRIGNLVRKLTEEAQESVLGAVESGQFCVNSASGWLRLAVRPVSASSLLAFWVKNHSRAPVNSGCSGDRRNSEAIIVHLSPFIQRKSLKARLQRNGLSEREVQVAAGVMAGETNARIAQQLFIDEKTVKDHLRRIYEKNRVHSRSALTAKILGLDFTLRDSPRARQN